MTKEKITVKYKYMRTKQVLDNKTTKGQTKECAKLTFVKTSRA